MSNITRVKARSLCMVETEPGVPAISFGLDTREGLVVEITDIQVVLLQQQSSEYCANLYRKSEFDGEKFE